MIYKVSYIPGGVGLFPSTGSPDFTVLCHKKIEDTSYLVARNHNQHTAYVAHERNLTIVINGVIIGPLQMAE